MDYLDAVKPEILAKYEGPWVVVSEYGIIRGCGKTKEELERAHNMPHEGCALQLCRVFDKLRSCGR